MQQSPYRPLAGALCAACVLWATEGGAHPQVTTALRGGVAGVGQRDEAWSYSSFYGSLYADVLFARESVRDFGIGPFASLSTVGFQDARGSLGATFLIPYPEDYPLALSAGAYAKSGAPDVGLGVTGQLFWGLRSYNYHSNYEISAGLFAGLDYDVAGTEGHAVIVGVHLDNVLIALPLIIAVNWLR